MILEYPNFVSQDLINEIRHTCVKYICPHQKTAYNRDGDTVCISENSELKELDNKIHAIMNDVSENIILHRYSPQFSSADSGYEYHRYNPNQICHYHSDGEVADNLLRFASVIIQLTTNEEGGQLVFPRQNKTIKTEAGKLVIFPPYGTYGHYVTPSPTVREVIVSWFVYNNVTIQTS